VVYHLLLLGHGKNAPSSTRATACLLWPGRRSGMRCQGRWALGTGHWALDIRARECYLTSSSCIHCMHIHICCRRSDKRRRVGARLRATRSWTCVGIPTLIYILPIQSIWPGRRRRRRRHDRTLPTPVLPYLSQSCMQTRKEMGIARGGRPIYRFNKEQVRRLLSSLPLLMFVPHPRLKYHADCRRAPWNTLT